MKFSSPHVHTTYCDGLSSAREMVEAALARGFVSIGFSGHAKQRFDPSYCMSEGDERAYMQEVRTLAREYAGRVKVWLGMERDLFSYASREGYDYVIASVHYLECEGEYLAVDSTVENMDRCLRFYGDGMRMARAYYRQLADYVMGERPEIIGHADIVRKLTPDGRYFRTDSAEYRRVVFAALREMRPACGLMELNTGSIARSGMPAPYPELFILKEWKNLGGEVIVSSDCHSAPDIACWYDHCAEYLRAAGYNHTLRLGTGTELFEEVSL